MSYITLWVTVSLGLHRCCKIPLFSGPADTAWKRAHKCHGVGIGIQRVQIWLRASPDSFAWTGLGLLSYSTGLEMEDYLILRALSWQWAQLNSWRQQAGLQRRWPIGQGYKTMHGSDSYWQAITTGLSALCFPLCSPSDFWWLMMSCSPSNSEIMWGMC